MNDSRRKPVGSIDPLSGCSVCFRNNWPSESIKWSRREGFNAPSADYNSAALALSYTGV